MDAAVHDAGSSARDAEPADAPWVGTPCSVEGRPGTCERVRDCTGDRVPTPGYCPGPAEIQCCTERPDGDAGTPADASGGSCDPGLMPTPNAGLSEAAAAAVVSAHGAALPYDPHGPGDLADPGSDDQPDHSSSWDDKRAEDNRADAASALSFLSSAAALVRQDGHDRAAVTVGDSENGGAVAALDLAG